MSGAPEKFRFDTVFGATGEVSTGSPRPKRLFSMDDVAGIKRLAFSEGEQMANASQLARQTAALEEIAQACRQALPRLAQIAHEHRSAVATLALACGRAIAGAALDRLPEAPLLAAIEALSREIESAPRLVVSVAPDMAEQIRERLNEGAQAAGFPASVVVRDDPQLGRGAFTLDFGDGRAEFDPEAASQRVAEALEAALAAEGLHAEPLIPASQNQEPF